MAVAACRHPKGGNHGIVIRRPVAYWRLLMSPSGQEGSLVSTRSWAVAASQA